MTPPYREGPVPAFPQPPGTPPEDLVAALRDQIERLEGGRRRQDQNSPPAPVSTGCEALDRLLPGGGLRRGTLVEWLARGEGAGAETLAVGVAVQACRDGGALVVVDGRRQFYAPAAARLGIELGRMIVVQAAAEADQAWALDQALRCPAVAAVLAWAARLEGRGFRRLQLAAEQGGGLGLLMRPADALKEPSWADVRFWVEPMGAEGRGQKAEGGGERAEHGAWSVGRGASSICNLQSFSPPSALRPLPSAFGPPPSAFLMPHAPRPTPCARRLRIEVLRCRGGAGGGSVEVEIDDATNTVRLAPQLARPTTDARATGA